MFAFSAKYKRTGLTLLRIGISVSLLWIAINRIQLDALQNSLNSFRLLPMLVALGLFQIGLFQRTWRWAILLRDTGIDISFTKLVDINYVAVFFNTFLPTGFGGDIVRIIEIETAYGDKPGPLAAISILDRILGMVTTTISALIVLPFVYTHLPGSLVFVVVGLGSAGIILWVLILNIHHLDGFPNWFERVPGSQTIIYALQSVATLRVSTLWKSLAVSISHSILIIFVSFLVGKASPEKISLLTFAVITPMVITALLLPSIQGLGVREGAYVLLLSQFNVPEPVGLLIGLGMYSQNLITGLFGGVWYLIRLAKNLPMKLQS